MIDLDKIRRSVGMVGESDEIIEILSLIGQIANTDISVLITGDTGSGKEMVAKAIHKNSKRKFESLVIVNCSAIPSGIIVCLSTFNLKILSSIYSNAVFILRI